MRDKFFIIAILVAMSGCYVSAAEKYSAVKIFVPDKMFLNKILSTGIDHEGSQGRIGGWMEFVAGRFELDELARNGIEYSIITDDLSKFYQDQLKYHPRQVSGFGDGSMGGYYTFTEVLKQLDSMKSRFPGLITARDSIGRSNEDRAIWKVKISDNPDEDQSDEPAVLFTALTHAREPEGMMTVLYFMWWLMENYGSDSVATYLVNNRQLFFIPVMNPDGYVYNQQTNPSGGGLWRKNRRDNGSGSYGVDLNRNFGTYEMWDAPNNGSSTNIFSETYRGVNPFSEPETFTIENFLWSQPISTCLNYHCYGNLLVYPWGYLERECGDSLTYREFAFEMVGENRFTSGTDQQTVGYSTRGNSDDYMYGGSSSRTFAFTPEVGPSSFWPPSSQIIPIARQNLSANRHIALVAGEYVRFKSFEVSDRDSDGYLSAGESFDLKLVLRNKGLWNASDVTVKLTSGSDDIDLSDDTRTLHDIFARSDTAIHFSAILRRNGGETRYSDLYLLLSSPGGLTSAETLQVRLDYPVTLFHDQGNEGLGHWQTYGPWGLESGEDPQGNYFSDSPGSHYGLNSESVLALSKSVNLNGLKGATLKFKTLWSIEPTSDVGKVEISTDGGSSWSLLRSELMHQASGMAKQNFTGWGFDGYTPGLDWVDQQVSLDQYTGQNVKIRFTLSSDGGENRDGWLLDEIRIVGYTSPLHALTLEDGSGHQRHLYLGEINGASDYLDPLYGEDTIALPDPGLFDVRWNMDGTSGTMISIKDSLAAEDAANIYTASIRSGPLDYPVTIRWKNGKLPEGGWHLRDTTGNIFDLNMLWCDSFRISDPAITSFEIVHTLIDTLPISLSGGWQLLSVPLRLKSGLKSTALPGVSSPIFKYEGGYAISDSLLNGSAYWIRNDPAVIKPHGIPIISDTISLGEGWHMISGAYCPIDMNSLECDLPPCIGWKFDGNYRSDGLLYPGEGFWVKGPNSFRLGCLQSAPPGSHKPIEKIDKLNSITAEDMNGHSMTIYFAESSDGSVSESFELPPSPPEGAFDLRYSAQTFLELIPPSDSLVRKDLKLRTGSYPVTLRWEVVDGNSGSYRLALSDGSEHSIAGSGSIQISAPGRSVAALIRVRGNQGPEDFHLHGVYPNPFNPAATIRFDLPNRSAVWLSIFDILGRETKSLLSDVLYNKGLHSFTFDARELGSGIYFCKITVRESESGKTYSDQQKMILIK